MKWRTQKKALRRFELGVANYLKKYLLSGKQSAQATNSEPGSDFFYSAMILLAHRLQMNAAWPNIDRWIEGVGWHSMTSAHGNATLIGEFWWGNAHDYNAGLTPEPLLMKFEVSGPRKRGPISYCIKLGTNPNLYHNPYSVGNMVFPSLNTEVNRLNKFGETYLMEAASDGDSKSVKSLIDNGADVNALTQSGFTALMFAVMFGHEDVAHILLDRGADANKQNVDSVTALMIASRFGYSSITNLLLTKDADVNAKNKWQETAFSLARGRSYVEYRPYKRIISLLTEYGAK